MWSWFKRKRVRESPTVHQTALGVLQVDSGTLLLADPMYVYESVRIEGVPPGQVPVDAQIILYPGGGQRIARVGFSIRPGPVEARRTLGTINVDSATVIALDERAYQAHWKEVGTERAGRTGTPKDHRRVAQLIGKQFGLKWRGVDFLHSEFEEPISEELESRITEYLRTLPEYAEHTFMYFRVKTKNSLEQVLEPMRERLWSEVVLDEGTSVRLFAIASGFGDGSYAVEGLGVGEEIRRVEIQFIGPAEDKILEAFPILRY